MDDTFHHHEDAPIDQKRGHKRRSIAHVQVILIRSLKSVKESIEITTKKVHVVNVV